MAVSLVSNASLWVETFGPDDAVKNSSGYWPYVGVNSVNYLYSNFDHASDCIYDGSTASIRRLNSTTTSPAIGNHMWLPSQKPANPPTYPNPTESWFEISNIGLNTLLLSFDLASTVDAYAPNMKVFINNVEVVLHPITLESTNVMQTVLIPICGVVNSIKIQNYDENSGLRVDNVSLGLPAVLQSELIIRVDSINNKAVVVAAADNIQSAVIPSRVIYNSIEYPVTEILPYAFANHESLTSVIIPASINRIGALAFSGTNLTSLIYNAVNCPTGSFSGFPTLNSVTIGSSVTTIPANFLSGCSNVDSITIPSSVTSIGDGAFYECSSLTSINLPEGVTSIGNSAFANCSNLAFVTIPSSVRSVGNSAFSGAKLNFITLPEGVTSIGSSAFFNCNSLNSVTIPSTITSVGAWAFSGTNLTSLVYEAVNCSICSFANFSTLKSVIIGNGVTSIPANFISGCPNVTSIIIPENVVFIGDGAFVGIGLTSLAYYAIDCPTGSFSNFPTLKSVTIGSRVASVPAHFLSGCSSVPSIDIPSSVNDIGTSAFSNCTTLTSIVIPSSVTSIRDNTFMGCNSLKDITIPSTVTSIGDGAFSNCNSLSSVLIPNGVVNIGSSVFSGCSSLLSIVIPSGVTNIGTSAFLNCIGLTSVTIPSNVTHIGDSAFYGTGLISLVYNAINCADFNYPSPPFKEIMTLKSVIIGDNVKHLPAYFLQGCSNVTFITIPAGVTSAGVGSFSSTGLTSVVYNAINCPTASFAYSPTLCSVEIGNSVTTIPTNFLSSCSNLISVNIPSSVTSIGGAAFSECISLTSITIPLGINSINEYTFGGCSNLRFVTIPSSVTNIGYQAFAGCVNLLSFDHPLNVVSIHESAFYGCAKLKTIDLPLITNIEAYAFANCISLSKIMFGESLAQLGLYSFANCTELVDIICYATTIPVGSNNSFANYNSCLYVPCDLKESYEADSLFGRFENIQCVAANPATVSNEVSVVAGSTDVVITWPIFDNAFLYTLLITQDSQVYCNLRFNASGQLLGIAYAPSIQSTAHNMSAELVFNGYRFCVAGLETGLSYGYQLKAWDENNNELGSYVGQFYTDYNVGFGYIDLIEGVYAQNGSIVVENDTNLPVAIYDVVGRLVASGSSLTRHFIVPNASVYIVKVGEQTMKLLVP